MPNHSRCGSEIWSESGEDSFRPGAVNIELDWQRLQEGRPRQSFRLQAPLLSATQCDVVALRRKLAEQRGALHKLRIVGAETRIRELETRLLEFTASDEGLAWCAEIVQSVSVCTAPGARTCPIWLALPPPNRRTPRPQPDLRACSPVSLPTNMAAWVQTMPLRRVQVGILARRRQFAPRGGRLDRWSPQSVAESEQAVQSSDSPRSFCSFLSTRRAAN